jgi:hypothetical protein
MSQPQPNDDTEGEHLGDARSSRFEPVVTDLRPRAAHLSPWSATSLARPLTSRQRLIRLGSAVAVVVFVVSLLAGSIWRPGSAARPPSATAGGSDLQSPFAPLDRQGSTTCVTDAAWSPDSRSYAVLGYQGTCLTDTYVPGIVDVYDAASGALTHWFKPDGTILRDLEGGDLGALPTPMPPGGKTSSVGGGSAPIISYRHILWSPDGRRLVLTFSVLPTPPERATPGDSRFDGILLTDLTGTSSESTVQKVPQNAPISSYWRADASETAVALPTALAYRWSNSGTLVPAVTGSSAIGNPDGGTSFTIWQPGTVSRLARGGVAAHDAYEWTTSFAGWSPDGITMLEVMDLAARLQPADLPAPDAQTLALFQLEGVPLLPIRDAALAGLLDAMAEPPLSTDFQAYTTALAWRPDGRVLAAYSDSAYGVTGAALRLYDGATGRQLVSLVPLGNDGSTESAGTTLRWSPDGRRLLLVSGPLGSVSLWGASALPR